MKTVDIETLLSWKPCDRYTRESIGQIANGKKRMTALEILNLDIPIDDRFWVLLRPHFMSGKNLRLFAADCAEHVLHLFEEKNPDDKRPRLAILAARHYANGKIKRPELKSAGAAAGDAAGAAAGDAAGDAARAAAGAAAGVAAWAAVGVAARVAARDAVGVAAWAAEKEYQIELLKKYLKKKEKK
jgi:hypothetical protein